MTAPIHFVIVGIVYILASIFIIYRGRQNQYDRGYSWALFSFFHGVDELLDGLNGILSPPSGVQLLMEKIELISIFLSSVFLMMILFIQLGLIAPKQQVLTGFFMQSPIIIWFLVQGEGAISALIDAQVSIFGYLVKLFILVLSAMPTLFLVFAYLFEGIRLLKLNMTAEHNLSSVATPAFVSSLVLFLFIVGEIYAERGPFFLYLEIVTIVIIMLSPIEINFGTNKSIQFFLVYHQSGIPLIEVRFNNKISDDLLTLVTGMLGAINSLVGEELQMGSLKEIQTEQGYLLFEKRGELTYALLTLSVTVNIKEKFTALNNELENIVSKQPEDIVFNTRSDEFLNSMRSKILKELTVWL